MLGTNQAQWVVWVVVDCRDDEMLVGETCGVQLAPQAQNGSVHASSDGVELPGLVEREDWKLTSHAFYQKRDTSNENDDYNSL